MYMTTAFLWRGMLYIVFCKNDVQSPAEKNAVDAVQWTYCKCFALHGIWFPVKMNAVQCTRYNI